MDEKDQLCVNCKKFETTAMAVGFCHYYEVEVFRDVDNLEKSWKRAKTCNMFDYVHYIAKKKYNPFFEAKKSKEATKVKEERKKTILKEIITFTIREGYKVAIGIIIGVIFTLILTG